MNRGRPFEPGNKFGRGRPEGSKNKSTSIGWQILKQHEEQLTKKNVWEALQGDTRSRLWCLDKLLQGARLGPKLKLPPIRTLEDIPKAYDVILNAVAKQKWTTVDAQALFAMLGEVRKFIGDHDLAHRLEELEELVKKLGSK